MAADNPFVYGEIAPRGAFVGREPELARLTRDLAAGQKIFLISPRRFGKSSLVRHALEALGKTGVTTVDVTVASFSSYVSFLEGYARALVTADSRAGRTRSWIRDLFTRVSPEVHVEAGLTGGGLTVKFPSVRTARDAARLAARSGRPMAVALDEFQAVASFNGGSVEQALRAAVQQQRQVGYVFAGSEPSLMESMIGPKRPFYKAGPV